MQSISNVLPLILAITLHPHALLRSQAVCIHSITNVLTLTLAIPIYPRAPLLKLCVWTALLMFCPNPSSNFTPTCTVLFALKMYVLTRLLTF